MLRRLPGRGGRFPVQALADSITHKGLHPGALLLCQLADALIDAWGVHGAMPAIPPDEDEVIYARRLIAGTVEHRVKIAGRLETAVENWKLGRMSKVDLIILRLATYELLFCPDIPLNVSIDEAIEIGNRYGSVDSPAFINGVLDHVAAANGLKESEGPGP